MWLQHELHRRPLFRTDLIKRPSLAKLLWVWPGKNLYTGIFSWLYFIIMFKSPWGQLWWLQWWRWCLQECCPPAHLWGEDPTWKTPNKCNDPIKVEPIIPSCFASSKYMLGQPPSTCFAAPTSFNTTSESLFPATIEQWDGVNGFWKSDEFPGPTMDSLVQQIYSYTQSAFITAN